MQGKATIGGHPIHPILVPFPIAFFLGALTCDIISVWNSALNWAQISEVMIGFGIIGGLLAAIFGFTDYVTAPMGPGAKQTATTHMLLNLLTVVLFIGAFAFRLNHPTAAGYWLTALGCISLLCAGFLGGKLVFQNGVGVEDKNSVSVTSKRTTRDEIDSPYTSTR